MSTLPAPPEEHAAPSALRSPLRAEKTQQWLMCGLAMLAWALRIYHLSYQSLWRDEVDAVLFATRSLGDVLGMFANIGDNGPLYFLGLHAWIGLLGQSEFAIRFPSAFFAVLAVLLTYRLGSELLGRRAGMIAALLIAVSPYHIWYAQEAKMYALISFLAPLSLLVLVRAMRGGERWLWPAWAALMAIFLYVHLFALMMLLVAATWLPLLLRGRPRLAPQLIIAVVAIALASLPVARWLIPAALTPVETGYYRYGLGEMATILLFNFSMGLRPAGGLWPALLFVALLALGCLPLVITPARGAGQPGPWPRPRAVLLLLLYLLTPLLAIWLVSLRRPTFTDRYLIITLPAFFLLLATGIVAAAEMLAGMGRTARPQPGAPARRSRRVAATRAGAQANAAAKVEDEPTSRGRRAAWLAAGMAALVVIASLPFVWAQSHNPYKADFRAAAGYIAAQERPSDVFLFLMPYVQRAFGYYHPQSVRAVEPPYTRDMSEAQVDSAMRGLIAGKTRVWLFLSEQEFWDPQGLIPAWFERNGVRGCQQEFAYIEVRCYDMK